MNIRRGLKVTEGFKEADAYEFEEYMAHARDFYDKYFRFIAYHVIIFLTLMSIWVC